jgi:hypothetical protein
MWMCSSLRFCRRSCGLSSGVAKGVEISVSGTPEPRPSVVSFRGGREPLPLQNGPREADTCSGRSSLLRFPPRDELLKSFFSFASGPRKTTCTAATSWADPLRVRACSADGSGRGERESRLALCIVRVCAASVPHQAFRHCIASRRGADLGQHHLPCSPPLENFVPRTCTFIQPIETRRTAEDPARETICA